MRKFRLVLLVAVASASCTRNAQEYLQRGNAAFDAGKFADASLNYQKALQKEPRSGEAYYRLGLSQIREGKPVDGYRSLSQAAQLAPGDEKVLVALGNISLSTYFADSRRPRLLYEEITKLANQLLAKNPNSADGLRYLGSLALLDRKPKEAAEYLQKADQAKPGDPEVALGLVQALFQDGRFADAERKALDEVRRRPAFGAMYQVLYLQYMGAGRVKDAENIAEQRVRSNPKVASFALDLAGHYAAQQKPEPMKATLQRLLDNPKDFPEARQLVGDFYARFGNWTEAAHYFEDGAKQAPGNNLVYEKRMVRVLRRQGKREEARARAEALLASHPKDAELRMARAELQLESPKPEDTDAAMTGFRELIREKPDDAVLHFNLGRALFAKGERGEARKEFQEAVSRQRGFIEARYALAEIAVLEGKPEEVLRAVQPVLATEPGRRRARLFRVIGLTGAGKTAEARQELNSLAHDFPQDRDVQLQLALAAFKEKRFAEAERILRKLPETAVPDPRPGVALAEMQMQSRPEVALKLLQEEVKKSPDSAPLRRFLGDAAVRAGQYDLAVEQFRAMAAAQPRSVDAHVRLGEALRLKGDLAGAVAALETAHRVAPNAAMPLFVLATTLQTAGRAEEAKKYYQQLLKLNADVPAALNNYAYLLAESGSDLDEALQIAQRALQREQGNAAYRDTLGLVYLKKNMHDSAVQTLSSIVEKNPDNPTFRYHLAMALFGKGDKGKARKELETALTKKPSPEDATKIRELLARLG